MSYKIEISIAMTTKPMGSGQEDYLLIDTSFKKVNTLEDALKWLDKQYGSCKKVEMFRDSPGKDPEQIGWIFCFKGEDWSHHPVRRWWQQDWVGIYEVKRKVVFPWQTFDSGPGNEL